MAAKDYKNIEILSPAGNIEKMKTSLAFGADAVYLGIPDFSLRTRINDFDLESIKQATDYCHKRNKKIYVTVNIFARNKHINALPAHIKKLRNIGVDALVVSDPGILEVIKNNWPAANLHLSTQANCTNWLSAQFWQERGVSRIILGREVTLKEIKEVHNQCPELELEYFIHGAMCVAYSGRCFLSQYFSNRSANLGDCIQPCRWQYYITEENRSNEKLEIVEEEHGSYILNSKDLCLIYYLKDLIDAGVVSFKIEGRAKSAYYQAMVAGIYSYATKNIEKMTDEKLEFFHNELKTKLVHRGYTNGFITGEEAKQNASSSHLDCNWEFCGQVVEKKNINKSVIKKKKGNDKNPILFKVHNSIKIGDDVEIVCPLYDIIKMKVDNLRDAETGDLLIEAHGGQGKTVIIEVDKKVPEFSVIRRKLFK